MEPTWTHVEEDNTRFPIQLTFRDYGDYTTDTTLNYITTSQLAQANFLQARPLGPQNQKAHYAGFKPNAITPANEVTQWQTVKSLDPAAPRPEFATKRNVAYAGS
jgi:hypothetical protein